MIGLSSGKYLKHSAKSTENGSTDTNKPSFMTLSDPKPESHRKLWDEQEEKRASEKTQKDQEILQRRRSKIPHSVCCTTVKH